MLAYTGQFVAWHRIEWNRTCHIADEFPSQPGTSKKTCRLERNKAIYPERPARKSGSAVVEAETAERPENFLSQESGGKLVASHREEDRR